MHTTAHKLNIANSIYLAYNREKRVACDVEVYQMKTYNYIACLIFYVFKKLELHFCAENDFNGMSQTKNSSCFKKRQLRAVPLFLWISDKFHLEKKIYIKMKSPLFFKIGMCQVWFYRYKWSKKAKHYRFTKRNIETLVYL